MQSGGYIMTLTLLPKQQLLLLNQQTLKYNPMIAEKDYFLAIVSKIIYDQHYPKRLYLRAVQLFTIVIFPRADFQKI